MFSRLAQMAKGGLANPTYNVLKRHMGRKTGTKFLEFPVRAPSKKQQKRRAKFMDRLSSQRDPQKEAIRLGKMERQYSNPKIEEELKAMMSSIDQDVLALSRPEPQNRNEVLGEDSEPSLPYKLPGKVLLLHLAQYEKNQKTMVDTGIEENGNDSKTTSKRLPQKFSGNAVTVVHGSSLTTTELVEEANIYIANKLKKFFSSIHPLFPRKALSPEDETVQKVFLTLHRHKLHIDTVCYTRMIRLYSYIGQYQTADKFFDEALESCPPEDVDATMKLWSAKVENLSRSGQIKEALTTLDRLQKNFNSTSTVLYNPLLRVLVDNRHKEESDNFWIRMHSDGVQLNTESFNIYLKGLAFRGEVERAFFVFREMVSLQVPPNTYTFTMLLHACGRAPWFVKGYEDIVFDALDLMEAAEFKPNKEIYSALINTFSQSGDAMAAEYYFWEMRRKGIEADAMTFNALLEAYSRAQSVGLKYGYKGRYSPPKPKPMSEDERAMIEVGAARYGQIMAAGVTAEPLQQGRGTKNEAKKSILIDSFEDDEAREAAMAQIRREAQEIREARRAALEKELEAKGWQFSVLNRIKGLEVREARPVTKAAESTVQVNESDKDDGKVRITWDDADEMEHALSRGSKKLDNVEFKKRDESEDSSDDEMLSRGVSAGQDASLAEFNDDRVDDIDVKEFEDDEEEEDEDVDKDDDEDDDEEDEDEEEVKEDEDLEYDLTDEQRRIRFLDDILDENTPMGQYKKREMFYRRVWDRMRDETFSDPFEGEEGLKGQLWAAEHRRQLNERNPASADPEAQSNGENDSDEEDSSKDIFRQVEQRVSVLGALDRPQDVKKDLEMMRREVDCEWDFMAFGRAPPQDYSIGLFDKQKIISRRALKVFDVMIQEGIKPSLSHWNRLLAVYSEGVQRKDAMAIFKNMKEANLVDARTYEYMIRLYIRVGDMDKALAMKDEALAGNIKPTEESYGLILRLYTHRNLTAEALKVLEEAHSKGITVHERNIKYLRKQCDALGVKHPNIPPDPNAWVKGVKEERFKKRDTSRRRVQPLLSKSFRG